MASPWRPFFASTCSPNTEDWPSFPVFRGRLDAFDDPTGMTECLTCAMQMEHGTGYEIRHPLELLEAALVR